MVVFSLSEVVTFLPEGVIVGFPNFAWDFKSQNKRDLGSFRALKFSGLESFRVLKM
jgi:hypothetical protein